MICKLMHRVGLLGRSIHVTPGRGEAMGDVCQGSHQKWQRGQHHGQRKT